MIGRAPRKWPNCGETKCPDKTSEPKKQTTNWMLIRHQRNLRNEGLSQYFWGKLTLFERQVGDDLIGTGSQLPQNVSNMRFFRHGSLGNPILELIDFLAAMASTLDFFTSFTTSHAINPRIRVKRTRAPANSRRRRQ